MSTWSVRCESCYEAFRVEAKNESDAIKKAKLAHEVKNAGAKAFICDLGPLMTCAFKLHHPVHQYAPSKN